MAQSGQWDGWTDEERAEYELIHAKLLFSKPEAAEEARERLKEFLIEIAAARRLAVTIQLKPSQ